MAKDSKTDIPDWVKHSHVTLTSYDLRVLWYGREIKRWEDGAWPFLVAPDERTGFTPTKAMQERWERYYQKQLGGFPESYKAFKYDGMMRYYTLPEKQPEIFDTSYEPEPLEL